MNRSRAEKTTATVHRLALTASFAALVVAPGCCLDYWGELDERPSGTDLRLDDVVRVGHGGRALAFGPAGLVMYDGAPVELATDAELYAVAHDWEFLLGEHGALVGELGTIAVFRPESGGELSWALHEGATEAALVGVGLRSSEVIAVGDGVVVTLDLSTDALTLVDAPAGGWGSLEVVVPVSAQGWGRVVLAGADGVAWVVDDDASVASARRLELGVELDIRAGGYHVDDEHDWLLGEAGLALYEQSTDSWRRVAVGTSADFVDFAVGAALTDDGELWDPARGRRLARLEWARGVGEGTWDHDGVDDGDRHEDPDLLVVGDGGRFAVLDGC